MGTRVQFNPSTLKAKYTAGTSKVQIIDWDDCERCTGETPFWINLSFSGITLCPCHNHNGTSEEFIGDPDTAFSVNLPNWSREAQVVCRWYKQLNPSEIIIRTWDEQNCAGNSSDCNGIVNIRLTKTAADEVNIAVKDASFCTTHEDIFEATYTPTSLCVEASNVANELTSGDCTDATKSMAYGGTVTITEL